jgi:predicted transposase/invertase (TIGR01784 family)
VYQAFRKMVLGLSLKQTRIYREAKAEGREEGHEEGRQEGREEREAEMLKLTVPLLLKTGMSIEEIAQQLHVDVEAVRSAMLPNDTRG